VTGELRHAQGRLAYQSGAYGMETGPKTLTALKRVSASRKRPPHRTLSDRRGLSASVLRETERLDAL